MGEVGWSCSTQEKKYELVNNSNYWAVHCSVIYMITVKVKQSRYRPGVAQRVPGS